MEWIITCLKIFQTEQDKSGGFKTFPESLYF